MTGLLVAAVVVGLVAAIVWAAPWVANKIVLFMMWRINRKIAAFNKRSAQRRAEMAPLIRQLEAYLEKDA